MAELVRRRVLGRPVVARTDATTIRELRRLSGLLRTLHIDAGRAYSSATAAALDAIRRAVVALEGGQKGVVRDPKESSAEEDVVTIVEGAPGS
jgi:hypothetical protein